MTAAFFAVAQARLDSLKAACSDPQGGWAQSAAQLPLPTLARHLCAWNSDCQRVQYLASRGEYSTPLAEVIEMSAADFQAAHPEYEAWLKPQQQSDESDEDNPALNI